MVTWTKPKWRTNCRSRIYAHCSGRCTSSDIAATCKVKQHRNSMLSTNNSKVLSFRCKLGGLICIGHFSNFVFMTWTICHMRLVMFSTCKILFSRIYSPPRSSNLRRLRVLSCLSVQTLNRPMWKTKIHKTGTFVATTKMMNIMSRGYKMMAKAQTCQTDQTQTIMMILNPIKVKFFTMISTIKILSWIRLKRHYRYRSVSPLS